VIDERWAARIAELLRPAPRPLATSVFKIISAEGFEGSYPTVSRHVNELRGPRFRAAVAASVPIETAPGAEAQFDWSDCSGWTERWGLGEVWCFSAVLCWSRWRLWWFAALIDREHTFEGLVRFFEVAGGVPRVARTDRMGALGSSQGRRLKLHPPTIAFAQAQGLEIRACQAGDAKRKGNVERTSGTSRSGSWKKGLPWARRRVSTSSTTAPRAGWTGGTTPGPTGPLASRPQIASRSNGGCSRCCPATGRGAM
jgi:transposase